MKAFLILEDGTVFTGTSFGAAKEVISEIVFNTSMAGYPEVLTDPSYAGQAVCMTYPLIGNYGVCLEDMESVRPWPDALIVRETCHVPSNFRSDESLDAFMKKYDIPGIAGIDTRALTKLLREIGTMNGMITTDEHYDLQIILPQLKKYTCGKVVEKVTCKEKYTVPGAKDLSENGPISGHAFFDSNEYEKYQDGDKSCKEKRPSLIRSLNGQGLKIGLLDVGLKENIVRSLSMRGCDVTVYPAWTPAAEILADQPDGIMISNGPGDPKECTSIIAEVRKLYESNVPIFAICLGHQLMALANGAKTEKLKYGHRGANQPVDDIRLDRTFVTSQNHGYAVISDSIDPAVGEVSHKNSNDQTCEGVRYKNFPCFTVQFHPEACGGPLDTSYLFDEFIDLIKADKEAK